MRSSLINLLCLMLTRLASKKGDAVAQINIHYKSGDSTLYFATTEDAEQAIRLVKTMNTLTPEARQRIGDAIRFADESMERTRHD